jgi:hypothetical protein
MSNMAKKYFFSSLIMIRYAKKLWTAVDACYCCRRILLFLNGKNVFTVRILQRLSGLTDFSWCNIPKRGKIYQMAIKYAKWTEN